MATATKPRSATKPRPADAMPAAATSAGDPAAQAKRIATAAKRKATIAARDETVNRSTRARNAMRLKAQAFDEIAEILTGR